MFKNWNSHSFVSRTVKQIRIFPFFGTKTGQNFGGIHVFFTLEIKKVIYFLGIPN